MAEAGNTGDDALRRFTKLPRRAGLLESKTLVLNLLLRKMAKSRVAAVSVSDDRLRGVKALEARVRILCCDLDSSKRCE